MPVGAAMEGRRHLFPQYTTSREVASTVNHVLVTAKSQSLSLISLLSSRDIYMSNSHLDPSTWVSHRLLCKNRHITAFLHLKAASPPELLTLIPVSGNSSTSYFIPLDKHPTVFPNTVTKSFFKFKFYF